MFKKGTREMVLPLEFDDAFNLCINAGNDIGKVVSNNRGIGSIVIKCPMKFFPPLNPAKLRITFSRVEDGTKVNIQADSMDGSVGFQSAPRWIDKYLESMNTRFSRIDKSKHFKPKIQKQDTDVTERLEKLTSLRDKGIITEDEYNTKRKQIIDDL